MYPFYMKYQLIFVSNALGNSDIGAVIKTRQWGKRLHRDIRRKRQGSIKIVQTIIQRTWHIKFLYTWFPTIDVTNDVKKITTFISICGNELRLITGIPAHVLSKMTFDILYFVPLSVTPVYVFSELSDLWPVRVIIRRLRICARSRMSTVVALSEW